MARKGLGRGLAALIGEAALGEAEAGVQQASVAAIVPNPYQPRTEFDVEAMRELVESVKAHGVLQPVIVRPLGDGRYELVAGERRLRAAREAGLELIPVVVRDLEPEQVLEIAIIENVQREDINPLDAATAYRRLIDEFGLTQDQIAQRVGKARPTIANTLRLLTLPEPVQHSVRNGEITEAHARLLLQAKPSEVLDVWTTVRRKGLSVRETASLVGDRRAEPRRRKNLTESRPRVEPRDPNLAAVQEALEIALGTKVTVRRSGGVGTVEIEFYSDEQLEGLVERVIGTAGL